MPSETIIAEARSLILGRTLEAALTGVPYEERSLDPTVREAFVAAATDLQSRGDLEWSASDDGTLRFSFTPKIIAAIHRIRAQSR